MSDVIPISFESAEQVRHACVKDNWEEAETVVVIRANQDGSTDISHNTAANERLLWLAHMLIDYARYGE